MIKNALIAALFVIMLIIWAMDRTHQYDKGLADCAKSYSEAQSKYEQRQKEKEQQDIQDAVKEAKKASDHIASIKTKKKDDVKVDDPSCKPSTNFVRDFNQALGSVRRE